MLYVSINHDIFTFHNVVYILFVYGILFDNY